jgi:hypothetical protein
LRGWRREGIVKAPVSLGGMTTDDGQEVEQEEEMIKGEIMQVF